MSEEELREKYPHAFGANPDNGKKYGPDVVSRLEDVTVCDNELERERKKQKQKRPNKNVRCNICCFDKKK